MTDESSIREALEGQDTLTKVDEVVELKDSIHVGPFQMEILKGKIAKSPTHDTHIMIAPLRHSVVESGKSHPLHQYYRCCMLTPHSQLVVKCCNCGVEHDRQCHLSQEGCTCSACGVSYIGTSSGRRDCLGCGGGMRLIVCPGVATKDDR